MKKIICFILIVVFACSIQALTVTSVIGTSSTSSDGSLTDILGVAKCCGFNGWITDANLSWTHTYTPIISITSATLVFDLLDADSGTLDVSNSGIAIGSGLGGSTGGPGDWHAFGDNPNGGVDNGDGSVINTFNLDISNPTILASLQSGSFTVDAVNNSMSVWGVNTATLTLNGAVVVPEPTTALLLAFGLMGLTFYNRKSSS